MPQAIQMALYALKRQYGKKVVLNSIASGTTDYTTGVVANVETSVTIRKAIVLPVNVSTWTNPLLAGYLLEGKGKFDVAKRFVILDNKDIQSVDLKLHYTLTIGSDVYNVDSIESTMDDYGHIVTMRRIT